MEDAVRNTAASNQDDTACLKRTRTRWKTRLVSFFEKEKKNEFEAEESFFFLNFVSTTIRPSDRQVGLSLGWWNGCPNYRLDLIKLSKILTL